MRAYLIKRLFLMIPTMFGIALVVFVVINLAPGSPAMLQVGSPTGEVATDSVGAKESLLIFKRQWFLDKPILFNHRVLNIDLDVGPWHFGLTEGWVNELVNDRIAGRSKRIKMDADEQIEDLWLDAVPHLISLLEKERAKEGFNRIREAVGKYREKKGAFPKLLDLLTSPLDGETEPLLSKRDLVDPWGRPYRYIPGKGECEISTLGRDGAEGGEDCDADLSRIWYPEKEKIHADFLRFQKALAAYHKEYSEYPGTLPDLLKPLKEGEKPLLADADFKDPWGSPYQYRKRESGFVLQTLGADKGNGGKGAERDLTQLDLEKERSVERSDARRIYLINYLSQNAKQQVKKVRADEDTGEYDDGQKEQLALNETISKEKGLFDGWRYMEHKMRPAVRDRLERNWSRWFRGWRRGFPEVEEAEARKIVTAATEGSDGLEPLAESLREKFGAKKAASALVEALLARPQDDKLWETLNPLAIVLLKRFDPYPVDGEPDEKKAYDAFWRDHNIAARSARPQERAQFHARWKDWWEGAAPRFQRSGWEKAGIFFASTRFANYISKVAVLDFGESIQYEGERVIDLIKDRLKVSMTFAILGFLIAYSISIPIGVYSAVYKDSLSDRVITVILFMLYALPSFYVGTVLLAYLTSPEYSSIVLQIARYGLFVGAGLVAAVGTYFSFRMPGILEQLQKIAIHLLFALPLLYIGILVSIYIDRPETYPVHFGEVKDFMSWFVFVPLGVALLFCVWASVGKNWGRVGLLAFFGAGAVAAFFIGDWMMDKFVATGVKDFGFFPVGKFQNPHADDFTTLEYVKDVAYHLVLPIICYTYGSFAALSRYMRAGLLEVIRSDYIRTARAKGLSEFVVIFKHALRNGVIPILTMVGGILPALIGGSVIIETIFDINGMGKLMFDAIMQRDYTVVMADSLIAAFLVLCGILVSDITYTLVDPRITFD
jgi:ABC-type dipeptide/oligopeptide/nickel transport system permease component